MSKTRLLLLFFLINSSILHAQEYELLGVLDGQLVKIDSLTGKATPFQNLDGLTNVADLTYHNSDDLYYSLINTSNSPSLVSIAKNGDYQVIGPITLGGDQVLLAEALAYHINQNKLYAAISLNGGVSNNDFYSETLVEVNTLTGECAFVTEISTDQTNPDIDVMTFIGDILYIMDGAPPNANFLSIYQLDIRNVGNLSTPVLEYESSYLPIRDFTSIGNSLYLNEGRRLFKYLQNSRTIQLVGTTHNSSDFNGEIIQGISKIKTCEDPDVDLGNDQSICSEQTLLLNAFYPDATYSWQDNSSDSTFLVTAPGTYWVSVENTCGIVTDTITVIFSATPEIELGEDRILCDENSVQLNAEVVDGQYQWQDGSDNPIFEVTQSGTYWVSVENTCGIVTDTVSITLNTTPAVNLGADRIICDENAIRLDAEITDGQYQWQDGSDNPIFEVTQSGSYWVEAKNACGIASDTIQITLPDFNNLIIPNVITPNGDGLNDFFVVDTRLLGSSLKVLQRTGKLVYESTNYQNNWDGDNLPAGLYYWIIFDACGSDHKGWVNIIH